MVTWEGIFQFCMVIIAVITLVRQDNNNKKR
ncbi:putative holin-like toxin [Pseudoflavonifractor sp. MSJ-30]|nr:putative holin-like toxin [Pseudoflavonifractor sp. MSJ-30]